MPNPRAQPLAPQPKRTREIRAASSAHANGADDSRRKVIYWGTVTFDHTRRPSPVITEASSTTSARPETKRRKKEYRRTVKRTPPRGSEGSPNPCWDDRRSGLSTDDCSNPRL